MASDEKALARLVDEAAIRDTTSRFAEAVSSEYDAFRALWADNGVWTIGEPYKAQVEGHDDIVGLLKRPRDPKEFFAQFAFQGPIIIDGDEARSRCIVHEEGRGPGEEGFRCHSVTDDVLRRTDGGWVFLRRAFQYIWLDTAYFPGGVFQISKLAPLSTNSGPS